MADDTLTLTALMTLPGKGIERGATFTAADAQEARDLIAEGRAATAEAPVAGHAGKARGK